ncbi:hypothetical protein MOF14_12340 [Bacillus spizizenii]|nr:hypothetical protein [Bacillus spizizenii]
MDIKKERLLILQLALQEAYRKCDECQSEIMGLEKDLVGKTIQERAKIIASIEYLQECKEGWRQTVECTKDWMIEIEGSLMKMGNDETLRRMETVFVNQRGKESGKNH